VPAVSENRSSASTGATSPVRGAPGAPGVVGGGPTADRYRVTAHLTLPPAPRTDVPADDAAAAEPQALVRALEPDVLGWLGFEHGEPDEPLVPWPRPRHWPSSSLRTA
jgi:hypothetical protein